MVGCLRKPLMMLFYGFGFLNVISLAIEYLLRKIIYIFCIKQNKLIND